jgi:hypothetical protein
MERSFLGVTGSRPCSSDTIVPVFFVLDRKGRHDGAEEIAVEPWAISPSVSVCVCEDEAVDGWHGFVIQGEVARAGEV